MYAKAGEENVGRKCIATSFQWQKVARGQKDFGSIGRLRMFMLLKSAYAAWNFGRIPVWHGGRRRRWCQGATASSHMAFHCLKRIAAYATRSGWKRPV